MKCVESPKFGQEVAITRRDLGLTQKQLGGLCGGLTQSEISYYEAGRPTPLDIAERIASALGVKLSDLS